MMQQQLTFPCVRPHTFFSKTYHLLLTPTQILISENPNNKSPKYILEISLHTQLLWKVRNKLMKAFGIFYKNKIKYFEAQHQHLVQLKESLAARVTFRNMASFYEPLELIGEGLSAKVIKSQELLTNRTLAVKMIKKDFPLDNKAIEIVQNEVNILKKLNHPNIAQVKEVFQNDDTYWIVQEYVTGQPLSDVLKQKLLKGQIKSIITQLLITVAYIQQLKIVHRDIKPENIIVTDQQSTKIKIVDFGFAASMHSSQANSICGTPGYYAPEILRYKESGVNSDMFSVGVVFYNLLTSKPLYRISEQQIKVAIKDDYAFDLLMKMLESDPDRRITADSALCHPYFDDFAFPMDSIEEGQRHDCQQVEIKTIKSLKTQKTTPPS